MNNQREFNVVMRLRLKDAVIDIFNGSQNNFNIDDGEKRLLYILAYNDGVMSLYNRIIQEILTDGSEQG